MCFNIKTILVILCGCLLFSFTRLSHPFYMGVAEMKYAEKDTAIQASVKLFTNDLEDVLSALYKKKVDLINSKDKKENEVLMTDYLKKRFIVEVNAVQRSFVFIGYEVEEEAVWMHLEFKKVETPLKVRISNRLLYDKLPAQTNIVHFEYKGEKRSSKVSAPQHLITFDLQ